MNKPTLRNIWLMLLCVFGIGVGIGFLAGGYSGGRGVATVQQLRIEEQRQEQQLIDELRKMNERTMQGHPR